MSGGKVPTIDAFCRVLFIEHHFMYVRSLSAVRSTSYAQFARDCLANCNTCTELLSLMKDLITCEKISEFINCGTQHESLEREQGSYRPIISTLQSPDVELQFVFKQKTPRQLGIVASALFRLWQGYMEVKFVSSELQPAKLLLKSGVLAFHAPHIACSASTTTK